MTPRARRPGRLVAVVGVASVVAVADQVTKSLALDRLSKAPVHLLGPIGLDLAFNSGIAFSIGSGLTVPIVIVVGALVVLLAWFARGVPTAPAAVGAGLVLGGAVGNLIDRLVRGNGAVVDFIHVGVWPTFNLADAAIVCGCVTIAVSLWRRGALTAEPGAHAPSAPGADSARPPSAHQSDAVQLRSGER